MKDKKFIVRFIIFVIILLTITFLSIYFSIQYQITNKPEELVEEEIKEIEIDKPKAEDSDLGIKSFTETYSTNAIKITYYYDIDGTIFEEGDKNMPSLYNTEYQKNIQYVQIDGLKDKAVQSSINKKLKEKSYELNCENVFVWVAGNFANVLSVNVYGYDENQKIKNNGLNFDLYTGKTISLEDVFVSSAPINSFLIEGLYEQLGWEESYKDENGGSCDMDKVDTSEYEDKAWMIINSFKKNKSNLEFCIFPNQVIIWDLIDKNIIDSDYYNNLNIKFLNHKEEIAIYKRYLTNKSIYEDDSLAKNDIIVMTDALEDNKYYKTISNGKITDNIYWEDAIINYSYEENDDNTVINDALIKYFENLSKEKKKELINEYKNKGVIFQRSYEIYKNPDNGGYSVHKCDIKTVCELEYFKEKAFGDYIKAKSLSTGELSIRGFAEYMEEDYPDLEISENHEYLYFNENGEFLRKEKSDY